MTNSMRHAGGPVGLQIKASDGRMRVEVEDGHPVFQLSVQRPRFGQSNGMGLFLVDRLADRWGMAATRGGKVAWFEIETKGRQGGRS